MSKSLMIQTYQPVAHFRSIQDLQDEGITTLPLPAPTTIVGMLARVCDCKFDETLKIAVSGTHQTKETHFSRGETQAFWSDYKKHTKNLPLTTQRAGQTYMHFKNKIAPNRVMNYQVLRELELTIFVQGSEAVLKKILANLLAPKRYLSLGRKEDFVMLGQLSETGQFERVRPKLVEVEQVFIGSVGQAIEQQIKLQHTYLPVKNDDTIDETLLERKVLSSGMIYTLPYTYQDLQGNRAERQRVFKQYVYIDDGLYPTDSLLNKVAVGNQNYSFMWM